jgi:hypothetical protein
MLLLKQRLKLLEDFQKQEIQENLEKIKNIQADIEKLMEQEDPKWKQRAKQNWFQNRDRNTKLFHAYVRTKHEDINSAFVDLHKNLQPRSLNEWKHACDVPHRLGMEICLYV